MNNSPKELLKFIEENDVKFIRLTFCDMFGSLKNLAIMPDELPRAFDLHLTLCLRHMPRIPLKLHIFLISAEISRTFSLHSGKERRFCVLFTLQINPKSLKGVTRNHAFPMIYSFFIFPILA